MFVPPPFTWTGFYVGANIGGIWSSGSRSLTFFNPAQPSSSRATNRAGLDRTTAA